MRIVTWNVNSLRARLGRVEAWIAANHPDVVCLQETKCEDDAFPASAFTELGYESAHHGDGRWNGVALISRVGLSDVRAGFHVPVPNVVDERRILSGACAGVRVYSVYVPNGRAVGSEHYEAKLAWLSRLHADLTSTCDPTDDIVVGGDFNVAPEDRDVWDISAFEGMTHVTVPERDGLSKVRSFGLDDALRALYPDATGPFSWWDYRGGAFHRGFGMRIDLLLTSASVTARLEGGYVDREARKKGPMDESAPSDHAPVVIDIGERETSH